MAQEPSTNEDDRHEDGPEFDLLETVQLVWLPTTGLVVGRTEYVHRDNQYQVQYVNTSGDLRTSWVYGDCIDHLN